MDTIMTLLFIFFAHIIWANLTKENMKKSITESLFEWIATRLVTSAGEMQVKLSE